MVDKKDVIIEDMTRTLKSLERTLRAAGSIEFECYHNARDRQLAAEFLKMANAAKESIDFAEEMK
ncbi:hypothetical protein vBPpSSYP_61 [Pseudomonas phage vB_PpS_SYP]|nr:hypothetical protein vBPpSSYP_61 [Pseudomonas phage vB_PpS_SYP]